VPPGRSSFSIGYTCVTPSSENSSGCPPLGQNLALLKLRHEARQCSHGVRDVGFASDRNDPTTLETGHLNLMPVSAQRRPLLNEVLIQITHDLQGGDAIGTMDECLHLRWRLAVLKPRHWAVEHLGDHEARKALIGTLLRHGLEGTHRRARARSRSGRLAVRAGRRSIRRNRGALKSLWLRTASPSDCDPGNPRNENSFYFS